jgi:hypothetical protein
MVGRFHPTVRLLVRLECPELKRHNQIQESRHIDCCGYANWLDYTYSQRRRLKGSGHYIRGGKGTCEEGS